MRVLLREEILSVAGSDGGGASGVTFDAGVSPAPAPSPAVNSGCPPGYIAVTLPGTTGSSWTVGGLLTNTGGGITVSWNSGSSNTVPGCYPALPPATGAPEFDGSGIYNPTGNPYGATGSNGP
jgi:hypothetical protein